MFMFGISEARNFKFRGLKMSTIAYMIDYHRNVSVYGYVTS